MAEVASVQGGVEGPRLLEAGEMLGDDRGRVEALLRQNHRLKMGQDGRWYLEPPSKPKAGGGEGTMGKTLQRLKTVLPLMKALEL